VLSSPSIRKVSEVSKTVKRILFLCATNDSLSLMAEALLAHIDSGNFQGASASLGGQNAHPICVEVMKEFGINLSHRKSLEELRGQHFDFVITLDETSARRNYSTLASETVHWRFDDPMACADDQAKRKAFQSVRDQIAQRLRLFAIVIARARVLTAVAGHLSKVATNP
jgi:protein-tyrosine-phosphatase